MEYDADVKQTMPKKRLLDLFSGTGSVSRVAQEQEFGYETKSLDILKSCNDTSYTFSMDILDFDVDMQLADWVPDVIWASPPCTEYSQAKTKGVRKIANANKIVQKTRQIIQWGLDRNPDMIFYIENPQTGLLKTQECVEDLHYVDTDYCCFGTPYRKRTRLWTNQISLKLPLCPGKDRCTSMKGTKHIASVGNGHGLWRYNRPSLAQKHAIPPELIRSLFRQQ